MRGLDLTSGAQMRGSSRIFAAATTVVIAAAALAFSGKFRPAEAYPDRPITVIVPYPAGGGTDIVARTLTALLEQELGVPLNVVNRGGGGGLIGTQAIADAKPDGYTLGVIASDVSLYKPQKLSDLTYEKLTPIGQTNELPSGITVNVSSPYKTAAELIADIKAKPNTLKGTGAPPNLNWHVAYAGLMLRLGIDPNSVIWVPTQGGTAGHLDVAAGNSTFSTASLAEARALIDSGKLRPLAVMANKRLEMYPDVPTVKEALNVDWTFSLWHGLVGPANLPKEVLDVIVPAMEKVVKKDEFRKPLQERGFTLVWRDPDAFREFMASDLKAMESVLSALNK